jgi:hypothetical protein
MPNSGTLVAVLVAHQGGWDEIIFVLVPISVFAGLLALANKRAVRQQLDEQHEQHEQAQQHVDGDDSTSDELE